MQTVLPDLDVFLDVVSLRAGEQWQLRLEQEIADRDAFFLFWSRAAIRSEWVEREWRKAIELRGVGFVRPVPLELPDVAPPPAELAHLHFGDWTLRLRSRAQTL